ncbi:MAG: hypothetical protein M1819_006614 [Sarea resinae]|nr:MAG: hypothetical protein M1819_006614 [Sarea resinae]
MADATVYSSKLHSAHVLVIGGTSGMGLGVAAASLENHAARVTISSSSASRLTAALSHLRSLYPSRASTLFGHTCDLAAQDGLEARITSLLDAATDGRKHPIDHVVYTAGDALHLAPFKDISYEAIVAAGTVRFFAPLLVAKTAFYGGYLRTDASASSSPSITLTTGSASQRPVPGWTVTAGYAAGLHGMVRNLAVDLAPVRVNLVSPGPVDTALWDAVGATKADVEAIKHSWTEKLLTGGIGRVEDVVENFLAAMRNANMTGTILDSNGGALLV